MALWDDLRRQIAALHERLLAIVEEDAACRRLLTIPGIGPVTALAFRAAIDWPDRFRNARAVGAWAGLTPRRQQSGQTDRQGRISKRGDPLLRSYLFEAALVLLYRQQQPSGLRSWGARPRQAPGAQAGGDGRSPQARGGHAAHVPGHDEHPAKAGGGRLSRSEDGSHPLAAPARRGQGPGHAARMDAATADRAFHPGRPARALALLRRQRPTAKTTSHPTGHGDTARQKGLTQSDNHVDGRDPSMSKTCPLLCLSSGGRSFSWSVPEVTLGIRPGI